MINKVKKGIKSLKIIALFFKKKKNIKENVDFCFLNLVFTACDEQKRFGSPFQFKRGDFSYCK